MMLVAFLSAALLAQGSPEAAPQTPAATSTVKPAPVAEAPVAKTAPAPKSPAAKAVPAEAAAEPQASAAPSEAPAAVPAAEKAAPSDLAAGLKAFRARRFAAAKAAFEKAVDADPKSAAAAYYLGYTLYKMGEPQRHMNPNKERAKELFATAFSLDSEFKPTFKAQ